MSISSPQYASHMDSDMQSLSKNCFHQDFILKDKLVLNHDMEHSCLRRLAFIRSVQL